MGQARFSLDGEQVESEDLCADRGVAAAADREALRELYRDGVWLKSKRGLVAVWQCWAETGKLFLWVRCDAVAAEECRMAPRSR